MRRGTVLSGFPAAGLVGSPERPSDSRDFAGCVLRHFGFGTGCHSVPEKTLRLSRVPIRSEFSLHNSGCRAGCFLVGTCPTISFWGWSDRHLVGDCDALLFSDFHTAFSVGGSLWLALAGAVSRGVRRRLDHCISGPSPASA